MRNAGLDFMIQTLGEADRECRLCMTKKQTRCCGCHMLTCGSCRKSEEKCVACELVYIEAEKQDTSKRKRGKLGRQQGINMHKLGENFVKEVTDVRWSGTDTKRTQQGDQLQFQGVVKALPSKTLEAAAEWTEARLVKEMVKIAGTENADQLLLLSKELFPGHDEPLNGEAGWWYAPKEQVCYRKCKRCLSAKLTEDYNLTRTGQSRAECKSCEEETAGRRNKRDQTAHPNGIRLNGLLFRNADPRYAGLEDDPSGGDVVLTAEQVRGCLRQMREMTEANKRLWLTTREMGFALEREDNEVEEARDRKDGKRTARKLAPRASEFIERWCRETEDPGLGRWGLKEEAQQLQDEWGEMSEPEQRQPDTRWIPGIEYEDGDIRKGNVVRERRRERQWEKCSTPLARADPKKLPDVDLRIRVGENWFLDDEIPRHESKKGYVRGQVESIRWEESRDGEAISISEGLATSMSMGRSWTIRSGAWNFLKQHGARQDDLTTFVGEEVARQQAAEEAGYRTPTWTVLRKLQALNEARRIDGGTAITLPPFFDNATRGGTELWGKSDGPTVYLWDTLTEEEKKTCNEQLEKSKDWVVWCKSNTEIDDTTSAMRLGKVVFCSKKATKETAEKERGSKDKKEVQQKGSRTKGWWRKGCVETKENVSHMMCVVHQDQTVDRKRIAELKEAWMGTANKDECTAELQGIQVDYWKGTEVGMLGGLGFKGAQTAADGSDHKGTMGAGSVRRDAGNQKNCSGRVGREEEGTSSNRPELGALLDALEMARRDEDLVYFGDSQAAIKVVLRWVGEGAKTTLATAPDADILRRILEVLRERIEAGAATFLIKIKAHRGEPMNEDADTLAEVGREKEKETAKWAERTQRLIFKWAGRKKGKQRSKWSAGVRRQVRQRVAQLAVKAAREESVKRWRKEHWINDPWLEGELGPVTTQESRTAMRGGELDEEGRAGWEEGKKYQGADQKRDIQAAHKWLDEQAWQDVCMEAEKGKNGNRPITRTWTEDFMLRNNESREHIGTWLSNRSIPWSWRRRLMQVNAYCFPCGAQLFKMGKRPDDKCQLCKQARTLRGDKEGAALSRETVGHLQSAYCEGQAKAVTNAHHNCFRELQYDLAKHASKDGQVEFVTLEGEQTLKTMWKSRELDELCTMEQLDEIIHSIEAAAQDDKTKPADKKRRWQREKPDGVAIDMKKKIFTIIEYKRRSETWPDYRERGEETAREQYATVRAALQTAGEANGWTVKQVNFIMGTRSIEVSSWDKGMQELGVSKDIADRLRSKHMRRLLEEHEYVLQSYWAQRFGEGQGGERKGNKGVKRRIGGEVVI